MFTKLFIITFFPLVISQLCSAQYKIAIEGMYGAGKTTALLDLISELDECILFSDLNLKPESNFEEYSENQAGDIFHQMQINRMHLISKLPKEVKTVLLDRSFYSNLSYQFALNENSRIISYEEYVKIFHQSFDSEKLDLIIFLDVSPEICLSRITSRGGAIPEHLQDIIFLTKLREFYLYKLPTFTTTPIIYINTEDLSPQEVKLIIKKEIQKYVVLLETPRKELEKYTQDILKFAEQHNLGKSHSKIVSILGYPTIYFGNHSIVLFEGQPIFFNNSSLKKMLEKYPHK